MKEFQDLHSIAVEDRKYSEWSQQRTLDEKAQMLQQEVNEMIDAVKIRICRIYWKSWRHYLGCFDYYRFWL